MKWKISITSSGAYKITPKTGEFNNRVLAVGYYLFYWNWFNINGIDIKQRDYVDDSNYIDEWVLIGYQDASLIAIPETYDRSSYFPDIATQLASIGFDEVYNNHAVVSNGMSSGEVLARMMLSKIVLIRTHGTYNAINTSDHNIDIDYLLTNFYEKFTMTQLVIYGACMTAQGGTSVQNLVTTTVACGVDSVIGFEDNINREAANFWSETFFEFLALYYNDSNKNLKDVCDDTDDVAQIHPKYTTPSATLENWVLAGSYDFPS